MALDHCLAQLPGLMEGREYEVRWEGEVGGRVRWEGEVGGSVMGG